MPTTTGEHDRFGPLLLTGQLACFAVLAWPGRRRWTVPRPLARIATGMMLGGAGLATAGAAKMGRHLRALPDPAPGTPLRRDGVYGVVRHPMYAGLLASGTGLAVLRARPESLLAMAGLSAILHVKAGYEEQLLRDRFGEHYDAYARTVPRLLPRPLIDVRRILGQTGAD